MWACPSPPAICWSAHKSLLPQAESDIATNKPTLRSGRAIQHSAFASVAFLFRQSKSFYRSGGKDLQAQQKRLLPLVAYFLSLTLVFWEFG